ncbi:MAG: YicC family protein [Sideroxydans sp.]|nr:YicC family protein [Sideroxydans sp.]
MILSMTGYANTHADFAGGSLSVELRAVNYRYLDVQLKMPDELRGLEGALRELLASQLQRGKIECRINYTARNVANGISLNQNLLQKLSLWNEQVQATLPNAASLSVHEVLQWRGMLASAHYRDDELRNHILNSVKSCLDEFSASRAREGAKLGAFLLQRVAAIEALRNSVAPHVPAAIKAFENKLISRLCEALTQRDDERIKQEIALFASKIDVDEELSRLASHLSELRRVVAAGGAVGKRLDFLMQELNREANTLGSKSVDAEVSRSAMEMKILIEQMREQIQNLE